MTRLMRATLLLALAAAATPARSQVAPGPAGPVSAFSARQLLRAADDRMPENLGLPEDAILEIWTRGRRVLSDLAIGDQSVLDADVAPDGRLIAVTTGMGANRLASGVFVCDLAGRTLARFPGAVAHRWSPDGESLALLFAYAVPKWTPASDRLGIWRVANRRLRRYRVRPEDVRWSASGALFLAYPDHVDRFFPAWGLSLPSPHRGADVSPDGRYAIRRQGASSALVSLTETTTGVEKCGCILHGAGLGANLPSREADGDPSERPPAFIEWVRAPGADHLLWLSLAGAGEPGVRSGVVDVRTWERVQAIPGRIVAGATDPRAVVVLRGDSLSLVEWSGRRALRPSAARVRIRVGVRPWSFDPRKPNPETAWIHRVAAGEWFPAHFSSAPPGDCDDFFRVERIRGDGSVVIRFDGRRFGSPDTAIVTTRAVTRRTASFDGGDDVTLSIVRR